MYLISMYYDANTYMDNCLLKKEKNKSVSTQKFPSPTENVLDRAL